MRGYCQTGILLFPKEESYTYRDEGYHRNMQKAVKNIIEYCAERDIQLYSFTTDEVGILVNPANLEWVRALPPEDEFFVKNNCENMGKVFQNPKEYPEFYAKARQKFPVEKNLSREQRFDIVLKRNNFITKSILEEAKLVVHFITQKNPAYSIKPHEGDNKIVLEVNNGKFSIKSYINGMEMDPCSLLAVPYGNRPLHQWEAYVDVASYS